MVKEGWLTYFLFVSSAEGELQRMATDLFHLISAAGCLLCTEHVCGSCGWELPQVPWVPGDRGASQASCQTTREAG